jgi:hypothetical protein
MTSPAAQRRPPLLHSPFVPSIMRCDSAEDEDKRQRAAARCALQQANIALFVCAVILKRIIVEALPRASPPGDEKETKSQEVRRHTGVIFTRVHARFLYEVVAPALGIPRDVLTAVAAVNVHEPCSCFHSNQGRGRNQGSVRGESAFLEME